MDECQYSSEEIIPLMKPTFNEEMEKAAVEALLNEHFVMGESVYRFEEEFAKYCDVDHAVSTNSGTDALQVTLAALGISQGQEVITSPASFIATSNAVLHVGARPLFVDVDLTSYTIDPGLIQRAVRAKTRAIIPIHLYGYPADMDSINSIAHKNRLYVIEDACQAHGAYYEGRRVGSLGDVACFSFYPSKNMTVGGDGGMIVTNDEGIAKSAAKLRDCGRKSKYVHDMIGYTARLNTVNAAIGRVQLRHLDEWNDKRRIIARIYDSLLSNLSKVILPPKGDREKLPAYHLYVIRTQYRNKLITWLESKGIQCGIQYALPIHLQPIYRKIFGFKTGIYPLSEKLCRTCLSLPMYPELPTAKVKFVSEKILEFFAINWRSQRGTSARAQG
jgi:perosamine synthetase